MALNESAASDTKASQIFVKGTESEPPTDASKERINRMYKEYTGWPSQMPDREDNCMTGKKI